MLWNYVVLIAPYSLRSAEPPLPRQPCPNSFVPGYCHNHVTTKKPGGLSGDA